MDERAKKNFLITAAYIVTVGAIVFIVCRFLLKYLMPFIIGGLIAWAVQKPAYYISGKTRLNSKISAALLTAAVFALLAAALFFAVLGFTTAAGGIMRELSVRAGDMGKMLSSLRNNFDALFKRLPDEFGSAADTLWNGFLARAASAAGGAVSSFAGAVVRRAPSFLISCIVSVAAGCYIAADFRGLSKFVGGVIGKRTYENCVKIKNILVGSVFKLLKGYALLMLLTLSELFIGFLVLRVKYALLLGLLIAVIDILPVLGTGTVLIPWGIAELLFENTALGIGLLVLYAVITVIRNFAEPKIIGRQMGINPLFTLLSMFIGIKLLGFAGVIIFPTALIVTVKYYGEDN